MFEIVLLFLILLLISFALYLNAHEYLKYDNKLYEFFHKGLVEFPKDMYYMSSGNIQQIEKYKENADDGLAKGMGEFAKLFIAFKKLKWKIYSYKRKIMAKFVLAMYDAAATS